MLLWTIIDGDIYLQQNPYSHAQDGKPMIVLWYNHFVKLMDNPEFPKRLQFWTRIHNDWFQQKDNRWDLEYPSIYWDNYKK